MDRLTPTVMVKKAADIAVLLTFCLTSLAFAQSRPFLSRVEVETLASGKTWSFPAPTGEFKGDTIQWILESGGSVTGINVKHSYAPGRGTWLVNDKAQLCVKFFRIFTDRCVGVLKNGEKFTMVDSNDMDGIFAELTVQ